MKTERSLFSNNKTLFSQAEWDKYQKEILEKAQKYESKHYGIDSEVKINESQELVFTKKP